MSSVLEQLGRAIVRHPRAAQMKLPSSESSARPNAPIPILMIQGECAMLQVSPRVYLRLSPNSIGWVGPFPHPEAPDSYESTFER
jgi:hypothetical protein